MPATKTTKKTSSKKSGAKKATSKNDRCWPGFEPTPGKEPFSKGSCKPVAKKTSRKKKAA